MQYHSSEKRHVAIVFVSFQKSDTAHQAGPSSLGAQTHRTSYVSPGLKELVSASLIKCFEAKMANITFLPEIGIVGQKYYHTL